MINIGTARPNHIPPLYGTVPINAHWDQYIPIVDEDGARLSLTNYNFELAFRRCGTVQLLLATATGEILKTTDSDGDILRIYASPDDLSGMNGDFDCTFASKNTSTDQVSILGRGNVTFTDAPAAFS